MICLLNQQEALELFKEKIMKDFIEPFPTYEEYKKAIEKGIYQAYTYQENEVKKAYMVLQEKEDFLFMPWYAVEKEQRGKGIGTKALLELKKEFSKNILIEVENEKNIKQKKELEIIQKRIKFYERIGFEKKEEILYQLNEEHYDIMIWGKEKNPYKIKKVIKELYKQVLQDQEKVKIEIQ